MTRNTFARTEFVLAAITLIFLECEARANPGEAIQRSQEFNIVTYGALEGGDVLNTEAIQKAVDACASAGGGRVVVPSGKYLTGTIFLKSHVDLHLEDDAVLLGSPWIKNYPPQKPRERRRYESDLQTSLIFAQGAHDISVTGKGTLNGNSKARNDFKADGRSGKHRPGLIWFDECANVRVQGVTMTSAGFWTETYTMCRNVHVDGVTVMDSTFKNNDGCNIVDCENFVVENCDINALDDGICLKAYTPVGCNNVVVRNNKVRSLCNGIKVGTDSSGVFQNILIENNKIWHTGIAGIALEVTDGAHMRNVVVRNIEMDVVETPLFIKLGNRNRPVYVNGKETMPSTGTIRDVHISGIRATVDNAKKFGKQEERHHNYSPYTSSITGIPGHYPEGISIDDVDIEILGGFPPGTARDAAREIPENSKGYPENRMFGVLPAYGFYIRHVKDIQMTNVRVTIRQKDERPAFVLDDVHDSVFHEIHTESITDTPRFVFKNNCTNIDSGQVYGASNQTDSDDVELGTEGDGPEPAP